MAFIIHCVSCDKSDKFGSESFARSEGWDIKTMGVTGPTTGEGKGECPECREN